MRIVLFGAGASTIVDIEESCARLGVEIAAIVRNVDGRNYALAQDRLVDADDLDPALIACPYLIPIFTPGHRLAAYEDATARGFGRPATIIDPTAVVASSSTVGQGGYVNALAVVGGATRIGDFAFINRAASIGHHVKIADFVAVGPGATVCGEVSIGRGAVIAAGAMVLPAVEVGDNSVVAAGAVLRESIPANCLAAGNPAKVVRTDYAGFRGFSV